MFAIWYRTSDTGRWYRSDCEPIHERQSAAQVAGVIVEALRRGGHEAAQSLVCGDGQMPADVLFALAEQLRDGGNAALGVPPAPLGPQIGGSSGHWTANAGAFLTCRSCGGLIGGIGGGHAADCPGRKGTWPK
jgi:hypothetical protein